MNYLNQTAGLLSSLEQLLNHWVLRLFPVWYLSQVARDLTLAPLGTLNPESFLSHRWLSLRAVTEALSSSLAEQGNQHQELIKLLNQLIIEKEQARSVSIMSINGVEQSQLSDEWPSLIQYAENHPTSALTLTSAEDLNQHINQAFPYEKKPHRMVYREWDGRMYWLNQDEPNLLAALQQYCLQKQRDGQVYAQVHVEGLNTKILDQLHHHWWLLLFDKHSIEPFHALLQEANLPVHMGQFEWRRNDLVFLVARKNDRALNRILLALIQRRSAQQVLEFGNYMSRYHRPLNKQEKRG